MPVAFEKYGTLFIYLIHLSAYCQLLLKIINVFFPQMFLYPDFHNCLVGTFIEEKLVKAKSSKIVQAIEDENSILALSPALPDPDAPLLDYCPSNKDKIPCDWMLKDTYESSTVICRTSKIDGAGDGLFAARDLPTNTIVSYYNGLHINSGEVYNTNSFSYQVPIIDYSKINKAN